MLRDKPVTDLMVSDVTTFTADQNVQDAMRILVTEDIDAGPVVDENDHVVGLFSTCLLYTSPSPRDGLLSRMPSSA